MVATRFSEDKARYSWFPDCALHRPFADGFGGASSTEAKAAAEESNET